MPVRYLPPILADGAAIAGYLLAVGPLARQFEEKEALNAALLLGSYVVLCVSVFGFRRLEPRTAQAGAGWTYLLVALATGFSVYILAMGMETSGLIDSLDGMDSSLESGRDNALLLVGTVGAFGILMLYPAMFLVPLRSMVRAGSARYLGTETAAFFGANLAIIVSVAHWEAFFADVEPYESITAATKLLIFLPTYVFFLLFYGSPRLLFLLRDRSRMAVATFVIESAVVTWLSLSHTAW